LGINEMTVPRATLMLSLGTALVLLLSAIWVGWAAWNFSADLEDSFGPSVEAPTIDGRLAWEVDLLFDTCSPREGDWVWPEILSDQDDVFLYPGELRCDWGHQGDDDRASVAVYNRGNATVDLVLEIRGAGVLFTGSDNTSDLMTLEGNESGFVELELTEDITEGSITVAVSHLTVVDAEVLLDVNVFKGTEERDIHIEDGDQVEIHYTVWDADTEEELDSGTWVETAGDPWWSIDGFGWSAIGLDIGNDRGSGFPLVDTGTSHITLLPPPIAYGNSDDSDMNERWLRFELKLERAPVTS
jgi:hypothetical protein